MGLDEHGIKFLLMCKSQGVSFERTAMVGRQRLVVSPDDLIHDASMFHEPITLQDAYEMINADQGYAETFLRWLGSQKVDSFDASTYENATHIHDFNTPISHYFHDQYSVILDGGTLEHVFNYPTALKNCMEMVEVGGHFLSITPTNNQLGHGFYQFSPELFFRVFSEQNGFVTEKVIIFEEVPHSPWYSVADPASVRERVTLVNWQPSMLLVIARKVRQAEIFSSMPQQSDYVTVWEEPDTPAWSPVVRRLDWLPFRNAIRSPITAFRSIREWLLYSNSPLKKSPAHYTKIDFRSK